MKDIYTEKCTIYNKIPAHGDSPIRYSRCVIDRCSIQGGIVDKSKENLRTSASIATVRTKDIAHYKPPTFELGVGFYAMFHTKDFYTASADDFIVYGEVNDVVNNASDFSKLKTVYKDKGFVITRVLPHLALPKVAHIEITNR